MRKAWRSERPPFGARLWLGAAILLLGILWTLDNLDILESEPILGWWPLVLVAVGVIKLIGWDGPARPIAGSIWLGIGLLLLSQTQRLVPWRFWDLWPVFLIGFGGVIVWRALHGPRIGARRAAAAPGGISEEGTVTGPTDAELVSAVAVWAGVDRKNTSQSFRGGDFTAWMGGGDIDLRSARTAPEGAAIEVFVLMGGVDIRVPEDWHVVNEIFAFMGGVEDSRKSIPPAGSNVLYLKGAVVMGGVEIKN
jgi:hypothetical protein